MGPDCAERLDPARTLLGVAQERWLGDALARSRARWSIIVQQTLMAPAGRDTARGRVHWTDGWDGYPAARERLLASVADSRAANPVVLGGDVHANYVCDLHRDPADPGSPIIASEFCGTSITSQGFDQKRIDAIRAGNAHIHFADGTRRGYVMLDFGPGSALARLRVVETEKKADAGVATIAAFGVDNGRPGIRPA